MKMTLHRCFAGLATVLLLGVVVPPAPAFAQADTSSRQNAGKRFNRGIELYEEGDYAAALVEFRRAYDLSPNYRVLYNVALAQYQLGDYAGALATLEQYLEEGGTEIEADKRATVEKELKRMQGRVGTIDVEVDEEGAVVTVDGEEVGTTPLDGPVRVSIGSREVAVRKGDRRVSKRIDVAGGDALELELILPMPKDDGATPSPAPSGDAKASGASYATAGVLWAFAGAGAIATVVTGTLALGASSDLEDLRGQLGSTQADREDKQSEVARLGVVTDVLWVTSAVLGVMALTFTIAPPGGDDDGDTETALDSLDLRAGPGGVSLQGTF